MRALGGKTPQPTPLPSQSQSPDQQAEGDAQNLEESLSSSWQTPLSITAEKICLLRDGYRCGVAQIRSSQAPDHLLPPEFDPQQLGYTQACHIIPMSLAQHDGSDQSVSVVLFPLYSLRCITMLIVVKNSVTTQPVPGRAFVDCSQA